VKRWCGREGLSTTGCEVYIVKITFGLDGEGGGCWCLTVVRLERRERTVF
jgi:hypothetical protein